MSGARVSVLTQIPRLLNPFPSSVGSNLSSSSLADSPETCEEPEGLVTLPGAETDIQIRDIPIVTEIKAFCPNILLIWLKISGFCILVGKNIWILRKATWNMT